MALIALEIPEAQVFADISKWTSVHLPIVFNLQRQDSKVLMRYFPGGLQTRIKINGIIPSDVAAGQTLTYFAPNGDTYDFNIVSIYGNTIVTDSTISGTVYGGFVIYNGRTGYYVKTTVYAIDVNQTYVELGTLNNKMKPDASVTIQIQSYIRSRAVFQNNFEYDVINKAVEGDGGKYGVKIQEVYNGVEQSPSSISPIRYWVNGSKQIGEEFGINFAGHCPTIDGTRVGEEAKFLTVFEKPTYFVGFPFSLSFIYSDNLSNYRITREEERFDRNGNSLSTLSTGLDQGQRFAVNRLMIKQNYDSNVKEIDVWLASGSEVTSSNVDNGLYYEPGIYEPVPAGESPVRPVKLTK